MRFCAATTASLAPALAGLALLATLSPLAAVEPAPLPPVRPPAMTHDPASAGAPATTLPASPLPPSLDRQAGSGQPQATTPAPVAATPALTGQLARTDTASIGRLVEAYRREQFAVLKRNIDASTTGGLLSHWLYLRHGETPAGFAEIIAFFERYHGWPDADTLHRRAEADLWDRPQPAGVVLGYFSGRAPLTLEGRLALARAERQSGRAENARRRIQAIWLNERLGSGLESDILQTFGALLERRDHALRFHHRLMDGDTAAARRLLPYLEAQEKRLAEALLKAQTQDDAGAAAALSGDHPGVIFAKARLLRRAERFAAAAQVLQGAPRDPARLINPQAWWRERKILIRNLLDEGAHDAAYRTALDARPVDNEDMADVLFHRGWLALRYAGRPGEALEHFNAFSRTVSTPISRARGHYWTGRAQAALGRTDATRAAYEAAARLPFTYYGQLAMHELGREGIRLSPAPPVSSAERAQYEQRLDVQVLMGLIAADALYEAGALALAIAESGDVRLQSHVAGLMAEAGYHRYQVIIGKRGVAAGLPLEAHAYPVPAFAKARLHVEKALAYAIARQESEFNPRAVSHANALGLMQVLPETAARTARAAGLGYSRNRLVLDPAYNMTIGSHYLRQRLEQFGGSLPLAIAAYNAGENRVEEWLNRFGDPRGAKDAVDWVERIPFSETRNYVQRVLENLQIYRALLQQKPLAIRRDLYGGQG